MSFAAIVSLVLTICKTIPIVDGWVQQLTTAYTQANFAKMKQENADAIRAVIIAHDQRPLEHVIGSISEGLPSGDSGAIISPTRPGEP